MSESTEITVSPDIYLLDDVLDFIAKGEFRIPKFQRPFVWRPEQMLSLFESIERGYPIGSLLIWQTTEEVASLDEIGGLKIDQPRPGSPVSYVLDGHQRLSTLFGCLRRPADAPRSTEQRDWMWWVYRVLGDNERVNWYQHWKYDRPVPVEYLPMRSILRTMDFLGFARAIADHERADELVDEAEQVAHRIKSYKMSVVRLSGGTLGQAVEVFSRLNSTGQKTTPQQMVSALTYTTAEANGPESLADRIETIQERVAASGFGDIPTSTIFQCVLAVSGEEELQQARWEVLARRLEDRLLTAVDDTDTALERTVEFLHSKVSVPLARLVPYNLQVVLLTAFFHARPEPSDDQLSVLRRWFWATSWAGTFAGANSTQVRGYLEEMKAFAVRRKELDFLGDRARPFPERFDFRSARARAYILWELRTFPRRANLEGEIVNPVELLARSHTETYRRVVTKRGVPGTSSPANRLILNSKPGVSLRQALISLPSSRESEILPSHGIPPDALVRLRAGDDEGFIRVRMEHLASREREFMTQLGVKHAEKLLGEADIDTE